MNIIFRTDASLNIGTGHVMRCLTLADALRERGATCRFVCREHPGHLLQLIRERGHVIAALPSPSTTGAASSTTVHPAHAHWLGTDWHTDAQQTLDAIRDTTPVDWLIVDHYALDNRWESALRTRCKYLMVIDDLADRPHDCDLLLDQNLGLTAQDYAPLLPQDCTTLIGPRYALLRPEFAALRPYSIKRRKQQQLKQLLITMGGVDKDNATGQVLQALAQCTLPADLRITAVMGPHAPWLEQVQQQACIMPRRTQVLVGANNMAQLMADSDLAIGAAGSTSWERCCLGLPAIQLVLADNQVKIAQSLADVGAAVLMNKRMLLDQLQALLSENNLLEHLAHMCAAGVEQVDGHGPERLVQKLEAALVC